MKPTIRNVANRPAYILRSAEVEAALSCDGAHMGPVNFYRSATKSVQPYYVSPWQYEKTPVQPPVLSLLRGDFFCLPFGGGSYRGVEYPPHGETSCRPWTFKSMDRQGGVSRLVLTMATKTPKGKVTKSVSVVDGQNVVYMQHLLEGFSGRYPLGHHATLAMPEEIGSVKLATSPKAFGITYPIPPGDPAGGEYYSLAVGRRFHNLARVPTIFQNPPLTDCSSLPRPRGYCDIYGMFSRPSSTPAWTAATFAAQGYLWFSLKDSAVLPCLTVWAENRGRHTHPWNGRNNCVGLEDGVCLLAVGMAGSLAPNVVSQAGIPTAATLTPKKPLAVNYIQGVTKVPRGFDRVSRATYAPGSVTFHDIHGKKVTAPVNHEFLRTGEI